MTFSYGAIDATPPSAVPSVSDGAGADIAYTSSGTQLSANWPASSDPESGILRYWYAIGTTPGGTEKLGWTNNGTNLSFTRTGLSLTNGQIYYVSVKAENYQGLISNITTSNGQTADTTAPAAPGAINDGLGADITYTSSGTQLSANWTAGSDAESGVARYWYAIGTTAGGDEHGRLDGQRDEHHGDQNGPYAHRRPDILFYGEDGERFGSEVRRRQL